MNYINTYEILMNLRSMQNQVDKAETYLVFSNKDLFQIFDQKTKNISEEVWFLETQFGSKALTGFTALQNFEIVPSPIHDEKSSLI